MKTLTTLLILALAVFVAWPFSTLYRLNNALADDRDQDGLAQLVDLDNVRQQVKQDFNHSVQSTMGKNPNDFFAWVQDGVRRLGGDAVDQMIDLKWVRETLLAKSRAAGNVSPSLLRQIDFAFFENWNRFVVRLGELGQDPVYVVMSLEDYEWRVTAIYP